ncbi:GAF domain-containing protein [Sphingomonas sp. IC-56]|uniref:GAF domain-containing protein n=1 Tax=Sphingomonas sp. IC-56 TaxID=2898529 RepID=UPI001E51C22A|nr:GAF domain-containing protein [Sphingomonas sp. IC-56]MCD2322484.1 GAF domain-containing protein [Sphingomonas sp. IC-56]
MTDPVHQEALALADDQTVEQILQEVCRLTGMGFAAVARVTEDRWIACQVLDKIEFGLRPGDELEVATTICDDIRKTTTMVVINDAGEDEQWRTHHTPKLYGFKSYVSVPIMLPDGSFFGTLCAIDPHRRELRGSAAVLMMQEFATRIAQIIAQERSAVSRTG